MSADLADFTRRALENNISRPEIARVLSEAGWNAADIDSALSSYADVKFPIVVPKPKPYLSAQEVFIYLILFASLYSCAWNVVSLIFAYIDRAFPDAVQRTRLSFIDDTIRWHIAALVVSFPLFLFTYQIVSKRISRDPTKRASRPRKWLTYLTLFLAVFSIVGDLVTLIYTLLGGEQSFRFMLKSATVGLIAGGVFFFFFHDIRKGEEE
jgi:hypothetical protein